ncbi:vitellogenin, partial [Aplysia californica]|uniref:Vitellogenin n=1 Tax=Aplysia californica TaxID=6500 RepID=A0ABM1AFI8_APLCA
MMDAKFLVILALAASASAGPLSVQESDKCSETCTDNGKFKYNPGYIYSYDYQVDTATSMSGASEDTAKLTIQTSADVEVLGPCEFALRLRDTRLLHSDNAGHMKAAHREEQFRRGVEASELRFSFQNGVVAQICSGQSEDAWVTNFKKGILSSFQNSMDDLTKAQNLTETDVAGECRTEYKLVSDGYYSVSIKKSKDILSCTER